MSASRPALHFTPPQNWMNDPNGLIYHDGEFHLFYQYNPCGTTWGHMTWGHAVSPDLVRWEHLPPAIHENAEAGYTIFSGSAVIDNHDTAGFGAGAMIAVFTADYRQGGTDGAGLQDVHIAYSLDKGRTFTEYAGNPVLHVGEAKFGDPKVFWYEPSHQWIMVNIQGAPQGHVSIYGSANLRTWTHLSDFADPTGVPGMWECPDLLALTVADEDADALHWVLKVNSVPVLTDGAPNRCTRYWVGEFDGQQFTAATPARRYRPDNDPYYAEVTYNDTPDRCVMFGWLRQRPADHRLWTGAQSLPRELRLARVDGELVLCHAPTREIDALCTPRKLALWANDVDARSPILLAENMSANDAPLDLALETRAEHCVLDLTTAAGSHMTLVFDVETGELVCRGIADSARAMIANLGAETDGATETYRVGVPGVRANDRLALRVIIDGPIVEAFAGPPDAPGAATCCAIVAPDSDPIDRVELAAGDIDLLHVQDLNVGRSSGR